MNEKKGFISSGLLYIGDPSYLAGDLSQPGSEQLIDPYNPFRNWERFTSTLPADQDLNLTFNENPANYGRGIVLHTGILSGSYTIEKILDDVGNLIEVRIKVKP